MSPSTKTLRTRQHFSNSQKRARDFERRPNWNKVHAVLMLFCNINLWHLYSPVAPVFTKSHIFWHKIENFWTKNCEIEIVFGFFLVDFDYGLGQFHYHNNLIESVIVYKACSRLAYWSWLSFAHFRYNNSLKRTIRFCVWVRVRESVCLLKKVLIENIESTIVSFGVYLILGDSFSLFGHLINLGRCPRSAVNSSLVCEEKEKLKKTNKSEKVSL